MFGDTWDLALHGNYLFYAVIIIKDWQIYTHEMALKLIVYLGSFVFLSTLYIPVNLSQY